jgi:alpha/beta superfamily hydrolase
MTNKHSITPPPDLTDKWNNLSLSTEEIFVIAAQWGADQELEACCAWLKGYSYSGMVIELRAARRPKPLSLKEQALSLLNKHNNGWAPSPKQWQIIRLAVEALSE